MAYYMPWLSNGVSGIGIAGINLGPNGPSYYTSMYPFMNLSRAGGNWNTVAGSPTIDVTTGWITTLPISAAVKQDIATSIPTVYGHIPPGSYIAKTSANVTVTVMASTGITQDTSGAGRATFTIASIGDYTSSTLRVTLTNDVAGAPVSVSDFVVCLASEEAAYDGGELFSTAFLAHISTVGFLRFKDWTNTDGNWITKTSELPDESQFLWTWNGDRIRGSVPYSVCAKLIARTGKKAMVAMPNGTQAFAFTTDTGTDTFTIVANNNMTEHGIANDEGVVFANYQAGVPAPLVLGTKYFAKNVTATSFQVAATAGGAAINITAGDTSGSCWVSVARDMTTLYDYIANILYTHAPNATIYAETGNEVWNSAFKYNDYRYIVAAAYGLAVGTQDAYARQCLVTWKAMETYYPRARAPRTIQGQGAFFDLMAPMFEYLDPGVISGGTAIKNMVDYYCVAPYVDMGSYGTYGPMGWTVDAATDTFTTTISPWDATTFSHGMIDGDEVQFDDRYGGLSLPTGLSRYTNYYLVSSTANTFKVSATPGGAAINITGVTAGTWAGNAEFPSVPYVGPVCRVAQSLTAKLIAEGADAGSDAYWLEKYRIWTHFGPSSPVEYMKDSETKLAVKNPAIKMTTYEGGQGLYLFKGSIGATPWSDLLATWIAFLESSAGVAVEQNLYEEAIDARSVECFMHFGDVGNYPADADTLANKWGLARYYGHTTPVWTWFRTLPSA